MLKFYYNPVSVNARRVWVALLEKSIPFEPILVNLDGDQFQDEYRLVNPLQRIPAIVDHGFRVVESLAILDYLEAKYPQPALMPANPEDIPRLQAWAQRLMQRPSWQKTIAPPTAVEAPLPQIRKILERRI